MKVMAIDPGGTTGVAVVVVEDGVGKGGRLYLDDVPMMARTLMVGQYGTPQEDYAALRVFEKIWEEKPDVLVMEDFRLFPDRAHGPNTEETIADRYLARLDLLLWMWANNGVVCTTRGTLSLAGDERGGWGYGSPYVHKSMPGERIVVSDSWLRENGLWRTPKKDGGGEHSMQALKHLIVTLRKIRSGNLPIDGLARLPR